MGRIISHGRGGLGRAGIISHGICGWGGLRRIISHEWAGLGRAGIISHGEFGNGC